LFVGGFASGSRPRDVAHRFIEEIKHPLALLFCRKSLALRLRGRQWREAGSGGRQVVAGAGSCRGKRAGEEGQGKKGRGGR